MEYEFHVGDYVETKDGAVGYVCQVTWDMIRWICTSGTSEWPIRCMYFIERSDDFSIEYKQIGQYDFTRQDKKIEKMQTTFTSSDYNDDGWYIKSIIELRKKINELIDTINELRDK